MFLFAGVFPEQQLRGILKNSSIYTNFQANVWRSSFIVKELSVPSRQSLKLYKINSSKNLTLQRQALAAACKLDVLKGCVRYIFASLFLSLNESTFQNKKKSFLFHFKSSFRSQENQILEFYIFKFHDVIKCLSVKQEIHALNNLGSKYSLLMKFGQFMSYYKRKIFIEKFYKNWFHVLLCLLRIKHNFYWKMKCLKQVIYIY